MTDERDINPVTGVHANVGTQIFNGTVYIINGRVDALPAAKQTRVFLSYARADDHADYDDPAKSLLRRLTNDLTAENFAVWWDRVSLPSRGIAFDNEIATAIRACDRFVLIAGPGAAKSDWVKAELNFARELCKPITTLLCAGDYDVIPVEIRAVNAIDCRPPRAYPAALSDLVARLREDAPLGDLRGVKTLPTYHVRREGAFSAARTAICTEAITPVVISAPTRAVAVFGYGGVGKTTLAAALAHDCDVRRAFRDGVIWLEVGQTPTPTALQAALGATVFGDNRDNYQDVQHGRLALARVLKDKAALIVLDDVWDHRVVDHFPVEETACRLLITTRSGALAGRIAGADIRLELLTPDEGAALIAKRAGGSADDATYRRITETLGGHTLAVALAAAQLENRHADNAADLLRLLTKRDNPFAHLKLSDEDKNENVALSLSLSYTALNADLQRRFRLSGVLALESTADRAMLAALWGDADEDDSRAPLRTLLDAGLLEAADGGRYRQHRLLRAYARALLAEAGETDEMSEMETAFARYADHIIDGAAQFDQLPLEAWDELEPLLPHVHEVGDELAAAWRARVGDAQYLRRAGTFAYQITRYVFNRPQMIETAGGRTRLGLNWLEMGLDVSRQTGDQAREALFGNTLGVAWDDLGEKEKALAYYEQALPLRRAVGDQGGEATTLNNIGMVWSALGEQGKALAYYEQSLPLDRALGDQRGEATTLNNIGLAWYALGDKRKALAFFEQALPLRRAVGDRRGEATTLHNIGAAWSDLGEKGKGLAYYEQALPILRAVGDRGGEATTLNNIGAVWSDLGENEKALAYYEQALPTLRAVGDRRVEGYTLHNMSFILEAAGELDHAIACAARCVSLLEAVRDPNAPQVRTNLERLQRQRAGGGSADPEA